jgi:hypothetical protein
MAEMLGKALKAPSKAERQALRVVQVSNTADGVAFTVTDSYRLHRVTFTGCAFSGEPVLVDAGELLKALATVGKCARSVRGSTVPVALEMVGESVFVSARDMMEIAVPVRFSTFPECGSIIGDTDEMESGAGFDGDYMADLFAAAQHVAEYAPYKAVPVPVVVESLTVRKPARISAKSSDGGVRFVGILMPKRR